MQFVAKLLLVLALLSTAFGQTGTVTIYRTHDSMWSQTVPVLVDGVKLASFERGTYLVLALSLGRHRLAVDWDRGPQLTLEVGSVPQFVRIDFGYQGLHGLHPCCVDTVDPSTAAAQLHKTRRLPDRRVTAPNLVSNATAEQP